MTGRLRIEGPVAIVPEWLLDAEISNRSVRLYAILHRYAGENGCFPSRKRLAERMHCSRDSVDRAVRELVDFGALEVEHHYEDGGRQTSNDYRLRTSAPVRQEGRKVAAGGGRAAAADGGREAAAHIERQPEERQPEGTRGSGASVGAVPQTCAVPSSAPKSGAPRWPPETTSLVRNWWDAREPKPAQPYPTVCDAVDRVLRAGWPPDRVSEALERVPTVSVGWLEGELRGRPPPGPGGALAATRAAAAAEGLL